MNLKKYKLIHEDEKTFRFRHEDGHELPVAKSHLGSEYIDQVRQQFSGGGEVRHLWGGGPASLSDDERAQLDAMQAQQDAATQTQPMQGMAPPVQSDPQYEAMLANYSPRPGASPMPGADLQIVDPGATPAPPPAFVPPTGPVSLSPHARIQLLESKGVDPAGQTAPASKPQTPGAGYGDGGAGAAIAKAEKDKEVALNRQADLADQEAKRTAAAQAENQARYEGYVQKRTQAYNAQQARGQQIFDDIASSKIDPGQFWGSRSTGQKLSASIGMILGGIGSAIAGGPNHAVQIIDNAIARDIDAQKAELGKKQSLLSFHMQQGHDLAESMQLAKADMLEANAANIAKVSTGMFGDKAKATAALEIAQSREKATVLRQEVAARGLQMDATKQEMAIRSQAMAAQQQAQLGQKELAEIMATGRPVNPAQLPDKIRERYVRAPDGSSRFAVGNDAEAAKVRDTVNQLNNLENLSRKMRAWRKTHGSEALDRRAIAEGEGLVGAADVAIKGAAELGQISGGDWDLINKMVPKDLAAFTATDGGIEGTLDSLDQQIREKRNTLLRDKTSGPSLAGSVPTPREAGRGR